MPRLRPLTLFFITATLLASWLGMQAIHEAGHILVAKLTGGRVANVVLHPLTVSRTDLAENPRPVIVCWAGPIFGVTGPLVVWLIASRSRLRGAFVLRFFAGFCLVANGIYIGLGWLLTATDAADLIGLGEPHWRLWLFGAVTAPAGLALWNGQGGHFGLGLNPRPVDRAVFASTCAAFAGLVLLGMFVGR
jgi:hypothetical protein